MARLSSKPNITVVGFGDEFKAYWTQVLYKRKTKMYNPIRQNYGNVQALLTYIGQEEIQDVTSIIACYPAPRTSNNN